MYLLQSSGEYLNAFASWGQFLAAGVTLFLLIRSTMQDSQIRKLTEMINELRNQTGQLENQSLIMKDSLALEQKRFRQSQEPFFVIDSMNDRVGYFELVVSNAGAEAFKLRVRGKPPHVDKISIINDLVNGVTRINLAPLPQFDYRNFEFILEAMTKAGSPYQQLIIIEKGLMQIGHYNKP